MIAHTPHRLNGLDAHARILRGIVLSSDTPARKRKRVGGVVQKLEANHVDWMAQLAVGESAAAAKACAALLTSLRLAKPFLESHRLARLGGREAADASRFETTDAGDESWTGVSPFFSAELSDALCLWLRLAAQSSAASPAAMRELLHAAVTLELADTEALQAIVLSLTSREYGANCAPADLVETLRLLSLAVKRCKAQPPPLDHIFCRLPAEKTLSARDSLQVLSSLVRLRKNQRAVEVGNAVSRNATPHVASYTVRDVVFGLEAIAILNVCHEAYASAVLDRCTELAPTLSPRSLGDVCKYVGLLQPHRPTNSVALSCAREMRRLLPALEMRAEQLLGTFSLRDARYVLRCFTQHKVRHSILFSRLTPFANEP